MPGGGESVEDLAEGGLGRDLLVLRRSQGGYRDALGAVPA
jgi:hypothetical protein